MRVIDLTLDYNEHIAGFRSTVARRLAVDGWNARTLEIYSHAGTHVDAPFHFGVGEETIEQIDPRELIGPAWVVDLGEPEPRQLIGMEAVAQLDAQVRSGDSLLLKSGWSKRLGQPSYRDELPRISEELAHWCGSKGIRMLGVEPPSVADVNHMEEVTRIHQILLGHGIRIIEGLCRLDELQQEKVLLIALPLRIAGGDGAPARVIAIEQLDLSLWS